MAYFDHSTWLKHQGGGGTATEMIPTIEMISPTEMTPISTEMIPAVTTKMIPGISEME